MLLSSTSSLDAHSPCSPSLGVSNTSADGDHVPKHRPHLPSLLLPHRPKNIPLSATRPPPTLSFCFKRSIYAALPSPCLNPPSNLLPSLGVRAPTMKALALALVFQATTNAFAADIPYAYYIQTRHRVSSTSLPQLEHPQQELFSEISSASLSLSATLERMHISI